MLERPKTQLSKREDIRDSLSPSKHAGVVFQIPAAVIGLLEDVPGPADPLPSGLSQRLFELMQASEVIWTTRFASQKMISDVLPASL